jgi:hypothetical protein
MIFTGLICTALQASHHACAHHLKSIEENMFGAIIDNNNSGSAVAMCDVAVVDML